MLKRTIAIASVAGLALALSGCSSTAGDSGIAKIGDAKSDPSAAAIEVANSGPSVAPADVEALFERFRRGAQRSEVRGHGLDLPIVSRVAEVHDGTVTAVPRPDGGLVVTVTVPGIA